MTAEPDPPLDSESPRARRSQVLRRLAAENFDVLIIGGGATGCGAALEAVKRGLHAGLIERGDFSCGTSSRSTKLLHGGVRYLEQAVLHFDRAQFQLVREALHERARLLEAAPHLSSRLTLVTPVYRMWQAPYYGFGLKIYDILAGRKRLAPSRLLSGRRARRSFPWLRGRGMLCAVTYADGQFDDARLNIALALTASEAGAAVSNYVEAVGFLKQDGEIVGVRAIDRIEGGGLEIRAKRVVNACGPFADAIRTLDEPLAEPLLRVSSGVHLVIDPGVPLPAEALLIPRTDDGRVLFLLPWLGRWLLGTTDQPAEVQAHPKVDPANIEYLLRHINAYLDQPIRAQQVTAAWSGLRPLVAAGGPAGTAQLSRDHLITQSASGLVTIVGGKWTTYRLMAEDLFMTLGMGNGRKREAGSNRHELPLYGAPAQQDAPLAEQVRTSGLALETQLHLSRAYGVHAAEVARLAQAGFGGRLAPGFPYIDAEVVWATRREFALSPMDVLARRTRLAFLDRSAALTAIDRVVELMSPIWDWSNSERQRHAEEARSRLESSL